MRICGLPPASLYGKSLKKNNDTARASPPFRNGFLHAKRLGRRQHKTGPVKGLFRHSVVRRN